MFECGQRVKVVGPLGSVAAERPRPPSAQFGKTGVVESVSDFVVVLLDGETRPRNFRPADLKGV